MKKILLSVLTIAVVGTAVIGGTIAFYSDTETSAGNIFVAGSIDLKVDHTYASYNGEECLGECDVNIYSNLEDIVDGDNAVATWVHPNWVQSIPGSDAFWIWTDHYVQDPENDEIYTFTKSFDVTGIVDQAEIDIASDNGYKVVLNGVVIADELDTSNFAATTNHNMAPPLVEGTNVLEITVKNFGLSGSTPTGNPAGLLYRLQVKSNCGGGYTETPDAYCQLWMEKNLDTETFFNFGDVKPGDSGVNVISLHVEDNDAWTCLYIKDKEDNDNGCTDPEDDVDGTCDNPGPGQGELSQNLNVFAWTDDGDGLYEPLLGETLLATDSLDTLTTVAIHDASSGNGPLMAGQTDYLGIYWCAGDILIHISGALLCDNVAMGNVAQTDSFTASLTAYAERYRNNPDFVCGVAE